MIETMCRNCGQRYQVGTDHTCPKQPAKKSTAARKDSLEETRSESPGGSSVGIATQRPKGSRTSRTTSRSEVEALKAGTQARPVDTYSPSVVRAVGGSTEDGRDKTVHSGERPEPVSKRGRGRPRTIADMKAYRLEKQRQRRAKLKAEGK